MLLKQYASRTIQRKINRGLKVKYALQTCAALAIAIWMIYQLKLFIHNKGAMVILTNNNTNAAHHGIASSGVPSDRIQSTSEIDIKLLGRKALFPQEDEEKPAGGYSDSDGEAGNNESYEMQQLASDDEDQEEEDEEEEEREVDRMEDLIDSNDIYDDDDNDDHEEVLDEDEIEHIDEHIKEAESTKYVDSKVVQNVNKNEIQTTMLMDT